MKTKRSPRCSSREAVEDTAAGEPGALEGDTAVGADEDGAAALLAQARADDFVVALAEQVSADAGRVEQGVREVESGEAPVCPMSDGLTVKCPMAAAVTSSSQVCVAKRSVGRRSRISNALMMPTARPTVLPASRMVAFSATAVTVAPLIPSTVVNPSRKASLMMMRSRMFFPTYCATKSWMTFSLSPMSTIGSE